MAVWTLPLLRSIAFLLLAGLLVRGLDPGAGAPSDLLRLPPPLRLTAQDVTEADGWIQLLRHVAEAPLTAVVSGRPPPVALDLPPRLRAGRPAALALEAHERVDIDLASPGGLRERLELEAGGRDAFVVRPPREGWAAWELEVSGPGPPRSFSWTGWVEPHQPLRILALSGAPSQESSLALRALEESGEEVEAWIHLGRDLWIGRPSGPLPTDPDAYAAFDVVLVFPGLELGPESAEALLAAVRERGSGLLLAGTVSGSEVFATGVLPRTGIGEWEETVDVRGDTLRWVLPPEVSPLPGAAVEARLRRSAGEGGSASDPGGNPEPLGLGTLGRGRVGALSLTESWRWRMEAGAEGGHREFWVDMMSWLAGGLTHDPAIELLGSDFRVGDIVRFRLLGGQGGLQLRLQAPEGVEVPLELTSARPSIAGPFRTGAFVPLQAGGYRLIPLDPEDVPLGSGMGIWVRDEGEGGPDPAGRLARLALASPDGRVEVDAGGESLERTGRARGPLPWSAILFAAIAGALGVEWALRRSMGRA